MSRKARAIVAAVLALVLFAGLFGSIRAADIPTGGIVVINQSPQGNWAGANFNPYASGARHGTLEFVYETLIVFNPVDGGKPTWWLATGAKYSDDLKSLTMTIRDGVKWSDGEAFTAKDVGFTLDLMKKFPALDTGGYWSILDSVKVVDATTITFNLKEVNTQADTRLGGLRPLPEHIWSKVDDPVKYTNEKPVGTGPFTEVKDFSPSVYTIYKNPNYWQKGLPYVDAVRFPAYAGNDAVNSALINDEVDWAGNYIPDISKVYVGKNPKTHGYYFWPEGAGPVLLYLNTKQAPFDDVNVRIAISESFDRQKLVDNVYGPGYSKGANAIGLSTGRFKDWINQAALDKAKSLGVGEFNPDAAKKLLDAAGLKVGSDGFRTTKDGKPFAFKIQTVNGWTDWTGAAQVIAQSLQDVGLNVSIETPEFGAWFTNLQTGTFSASMGWSNYNRTPWDFYQQTMDSSLITKGADGKESANGTTWGRFTSPETDKLLADFTHTADAAKQKDIANQLQLAYVTNVVSIPIFWNPQWYEWNLTRFTGFPTQDNYFAQGSPWNAPGALLTVLKLHCIDATSCGQKK